MSLRYFPWDFVQRMGSWALGLVTLIGTPAVFFGYAQILLCVWSIEKCGAVLRLTDRTARMREGTSKRMEKSSMEVGKKKNSREKYCGKYSYPHCI